VSILLSSIGPVVKLLLDIPVKVCVANTDSLLTFISYILVVLLLNVQRHRHFYPQALYIKNPGASHAMKQLLYEPAAVVQ